MTRVPSPDVWRRLCADALADLERMTERGETWIDHAARGDRGWPTSTAGGGSRSGDVADPTGGIAADGRPDRDETLRRVLADAEKILAALGKARMALDGLVPEWPSGGVVVTDRRLGSANAVDACTVCGEVAPPLRAGKCGDCFGAWVADGRPDVARFRYERRKAAERAVEAERAQRRSERRRGRFAVALAARLGNS